ncbi:MAG: hypothetical protein AAGB93_14615 [Planctomycetota bacterium]
MTTTPSDLMGTAAPVRHDLAPSPAPARAVDPIHGRRPSGGRRERGLTHETLVYLGAGIPLAFVFSLTPLLGFMGWFLASLFHEVGHSAMAWFTGHPSVPAIALTGNAVAVHGEPLTFLRLVVVGSVVTLSVQLLRGSRRVAVLAAFGVLYPLMLWTRLGSIAFLVAGHLGELAAASLCLWRAADGEACHSRAERVLYAMLGWFLCGDNILLSFGLAFSSSARAEYETNGSFGLVNDYLRLANHELGASIERVGFAMGLIAVAVPLLTLTAFALTRSRA